MRRRKLLGALAVGFAVIAIGVIALWPRPVVPALTQETFDRVRVGMTLPEVEALLGNPDWRSGGGFELLSANGTPIVDHPDCGIWHWGYESVVSVSFDAYGMVSSKFSEVFLVREPTSFESSLWRVKRQWREWFPVQEARE